MFRLFAVLFSLFCFREIFQFQNDEKKNNSNEIKQSTT